VITLVEGHEADEVFDQEGFDRALEKGGYAAVVTDDLLRWSDGIRAQAVTRDGRLVDDFATLWSEGALHVLNAPSPAATASLAIGEWLAGALDAAGALVG